MDASSYTQQIVNVVEKYCKRFYIRANRCERITKQLLQNQNGKTIEIENIVYKVCSIEYQSFRKVQER